MRTRPLLAGVLITQFGVAATAQQPRTSNVGPPPPPAAQEQPQKPDEDDVVKITSNLVQVDAVVTDKDGQAVSDLKAEEVQVFEDGKPQKVSHFSYNLTEVNKAAAPAKTGNDPKNAA